MNKTIGTFFARHGLPISILMLPSTSPHIIISCSRKQGHSFGVGGAALFLSSFRPALSPSLRLASPRPNVENNNVTWRGGKRNILLDTYLVRTHSAHFLQSKQARGIGQDWIGPTFRHRSYHRIVSWLGKAESTRFVIRSCVRRKQAGFCGSIR